MPVAAAPPALGKSNHFGIEVAESIVWQGWEPGREYTRHITLKNVKVKTQKLSYKGPSTRFFSTLYPQAIVLSAGTSYTLPVTFRPLEKVLYNDTVEFDTNGGAFSVPIRAVLPQANIQIPDQISLGMCAAQDFRQVTFDIQNVSELETPFAIESQAPFQVSPPEGSLDPFSTITVTMTFTPQAAVVYEADLVVKYGADLSHSKVTRCEGIGKYPHLLVKSSASHPEDNSSTETVVNFGQVSIGKTVDRWIELHNMSQVNAPFTVDHPRVGPGRLDTVFKCLQQEGVVPAKSSCRIPVSFTPNTVGIKSVDYFHVRAIGNISKTTITCIGACNGPRVHLSRNVINFSQLDAGRASTKTIEVINDSDTEAIFQFQLDCAESVFKFEHLSGLLPANSKRTLSLRFEPIHAIHYHRRVACLIHNQGTLFLDLLGTCHSETVKPAILQIKHLHRYRTHVDRGLSFTPPEQLNDELSDGKLKLDENGALYKEESDLLISKNSESALNPVDEYFNDGYHSDLTHGPAPHTSLDVHQADFGQCTDINGLQQKCVNVTNHTKGKITVVWMGDSSHIFSVTPTSLDLPPQGSSSFTVSFRPSAPNQFFGAELECYAFYKSLRDYRLVEENTHCPPWCMTLMATGHTFLPGNETFLPRYFLDTPNVTFPAVNAHEATYRTLLLTNTGTTPILYDMDQELLKGTVYSVKPTKGLLAANQHQLFVVKCLPTAVKLYKSTAKLHLNAADKNNQDISLLGSAEAAEVILDEDGIIYFKPTCVGTITSRKYAVKNTSRIPLHFEWKMLHSDADVLSVEPVTGIIQPNENQYHTWSFTPKSQDKYVMKPALIVWGQGQATRTSGGKKRQFEVRALGDGNIGEIKCLDAYIQCGNIVVGSQATHSITLLNDSDCNLEYSLDVTQEADGPDAESYRDPLALILDKTSGVLPARSKEVIDFVARPPRRMCYRWSVCYNLRSSYSSDPPASPVEPQFICHILATGVFPTMSITDAHCYGSAIGISKKQLWELFSLDNLNVAIDADPSAAELKYTVATRQSHRRRAPVYTRSVLDFNFSAAPVNSDPCVVQLMLENTGAVTCEWSFLFPNDLQMELEYWAETGDFDEEELHQLKVMDNKLFTVEPKRGRMEPNQCQTVTFSYSHCMAGTDRLPVLLKLTRGREILLNFVGVTVEPERRYLHFPSSSFMFSPIPIGEKVPPSQVYELYNGGSLPVKYELDVTPLALLKEENYDHDIFEVVNPMGEILPGQMRAIEWKFSPLEAKTYMVDIPIHVHNGDTAMVTFTGVGYDKRALGNSMTMTDNNDTSGVPSVQSVPLPGQLCFLSQERISFGNIPLFTRPRQVVVISNRSQDHGVMYKWHVTSKDDAQVAQIHPRAGRLPPGGAQICHVTFVSFGFPSFYDINMICEVTNLTDHCDYEKQLQAWSSERDRQKVEFTINKENSVVSLTEFREYENGLKQWTETQERQAKEFIIRERDVRGGSRESCDHASDGRSGSASGSRPPSGKLSSLEPTRTPSPEVDFAKYKTLPPIRQYAIDQERDIQRANRRFNDKFWACPQPPKPFLLHLGVTARTHDVAEYQQNFPDEYSKYCIDRTLCEQKTDVAKKITTSEVTEPIKCLSAEADLVAGAITDVLRGLLDDTQFQDTCHKVINAPIPYFNQFTSKSRPIQTPVTEAAATPDIEPPEGSQASRAVDDGSPMVGSQPGSRLMSPANSDQDSIGSAQSQTRQQSAQTHTASQQISPKPDTTQQISPQPDIMADQDGTSQVSERAEAMTVMSGVSERLLSAVGRDSGISHRLGSGNVSRPLSKQEDAKFSEKQSLKKLTEFSNAAETLIENTLSNILDEAFSGEFNITARPRLIALPPRSATGGSH